LALTSSGGGRFRCMLSKVSDWNDGKSLAGGEEEGCSVSSSRRITVLNSSSAYACQLVMVLYKQTENFAPMESNRSITPEVLERKMHTSRKDGEDDAIPSRGRALYVKVGNVHAINMRSRISGRPDIFGINLEPRISGQLHRAKCSVA
jgi:hypothetical protein